MPKEIPSYFYIKEVFTIDYSDHSEDTAYDYDDYPECNNDVEDVFAMENDTSEMSAQSLAVSLGFAEEIAAAETAEYKVEYGIDETDVDMPIVGRIEKVSLVTSKESKVNLHQRDPHFLDYVKQVCSGGDIENHIQTSWEEIF